MSFRPIQFQPMQFQPLSFQPITLSTACNFQPHATSTACNFNRSPFQVGDCSQMRQDVLESVATLYDLHLFFDFFITGALGTNNSSRLLKVFKFLHFRIFIQIP